MASTVPSDFSTTSDAAAGSGTGSISAPVSSTPQGDFSSDPRVYYNTQTGKWQFEDDDGNEFEWDQLRNTWAPVVDDELIEAQQRAYSVAGVDESAPAVPVTARDKKKRKRDGGGEEASTEPPRKKEPKNPSQAARNTAIYVTNLPLDCTVPQLRSSFQSKCGVILESADGEPKIKLYTTPDGRPKGEALIVFLKEESVTLAMALMDDTILPNEDGEIPLEGGSQRIRVQKADFGHKTTEENGTNGTEGKGKGGGGKRGGDTERKKAQRRAEKLKKKLEDWSSDEESSKAAAAAAARFSRVVVLKRMFTSEELAQDPSLLLDLKEDVREECETIGEVTNVVLYDKEPEGVMTVKFKEEIAAKACVLKMNNRFFGGRQVQALIYDGQQRYRKSGQGATTAASGGPSATVEGGQEATDEEEKKRLEDFGNWLESQG